MRLPVVPCALSAAVCLAAAPAAAIAPERVLVLFNAHDTADEDGNGTPDSRQVAEYYAARRGVPATNLLGLACSTLLDYTPAQYTNFLDEVVRPVLARADRRGPPAFDVLLFCYRTPVTYHGGQRSIDNAMYCPGLVLQGCPTNPPVVGNPYLDPCPGVRGDGRPFRHRDNTVGFSDCFLVTRLDGPGGVWRVMDLVDQALYAEAFLQPDEGFFRGCGYVDSRALKGAYAIETLTNDPDVASGRCDSYGAADVNIACGARHVAAAGFPLRWENTPVSIGVTNAAFQDGTPATNAPQAMFYGGWYNLDAYKDVFEWLPGSLACDLNSDSLYAWQFRRPVKTFGPNALARGASCVAGVVSEPYVNGHPRPYILLYYLLHGYTFAEAAGAAMPMLNWAGLSVGDPLYAPLRPGRPKVKDERPPSFAPGFPDIVTNAVRGIECRIEVAAEAEPEAVRAEIAWGDSPAMTNAPLRGQGWYRRQRLRFPELAAGGAYWCRVTATDPAGHCATSGVLRFDVPGRRPFEGVARRIPGTIQAEHYDEGIEGVTSHGWGLPERTFRGEQGFELKPTGRPEGAPAFLDGRQPEGAWLEYTADIATGGLYRLDVVCGGFHGRGGEIRLRQDGEDRTGVWALPTNAPRAYDTWTTSSVPVRLDAGRHVLRLELLRRHNAPLDRLVFEPAEERTARPRAAAGGIDTVAPSADTRPPRCPCPPTLPPTPPDSPRWTRP
jgi:uncharacterized protein (TIGR03790 family)